MEKYLEIKNYLVKNNIEYTENEMHGDENFWYFSIIEGFAINVIISYCSKTDLTQIEIYNKKYGTYSNLADILSDPDTILNIKKFLLYYM